MMMRPTRTLALTTLLAAVALAPPAGARWKAAFANQPPEIQKWYQEQQNALGQWCCDKADGHSFFGAYTFNADGSVTLHVGPQETHTLPAYMVLHGPNPTGHAVWWYVQAGDMHKDYCFAPGSLI